MAATQRRAVWTGTAALFALAVVLVWVWPRLPASNAGEVLSTVAQALAAVLAIVFALGLVAVEAGGQYAHRVSLLNRELIAFALATGAAVLLSMWLLAESEPSADWTRVSYTLAAGSLLLLVPFIVGFTDELSPDNVVRRLERAARGEGEEARSATAALENVVMSAAAQRDYETFQRGLAALAELPPREGLDPVERFEEIGHGFVADPAAMRVLARVSLDVVARSDAERAERLVRALAGVAVAASRHGQQLSARPLILMLGTIALAAAVRLEEGAGEQAREDFARQTTQVLAELGEQFVRDEHRTAAQLAVAQLGFVVREHARAVGTSDSAMVDTSRAVDALGGVGAAAARARLREVVPTAIDALREAGAPAARALSDAFPAAVACDRLEEVGGAGDAPTAARVVEALEAVARAAVERDAAELPMRVGRSLGRLWDATGGDDDARQVLVAPLALACGRTAQAIVGRMPQSALYAGTADVLVEGMVRLLHAVALEEVRIRRWGQPLAAEWLGHVARAAIEGGEDVIARDALGSLGVAAETAVRVPAGHLLEYDYALRYPVRDLGGLGAAAAGAGLADAASLAVSGLRTAAIAMQEEGRLEALDAVVDALGEVAAAGDGGGAAGEAAELRDELAALVED